MKFIRLLLLKLLRGIPIEVVYVTDATLGERKAGHSNDPCGLCGYFTPLRVPAAVATAYLVLGGSGRGYAGATEVDRRASEAAFAMARLLLQKSRESQT